MSSGVTFNYVTFADLADADKKHPFVAPRLKGGIFSKYYNCPDIFPEFPVYFYLLKDNDIISEIIAIPDTLYDIEGAMRPWAWTGGLYTNSEYRGHGYATQLIKKTVRVFSEHNIYRGSVYSAQETLNIYSKFENSLCAFVPRFVFLKSLIPFLRTRIDNSKALYFINSLYSSFFYIPYKYLFKSLSIFSSYRFFEVSIQQLMDIDEWSICNIDKYSFNCSKEKLVWKLNQTKYEHRLFFLRDKHGINVAYIILRSKEVDINDNMKFSGYKLLSLVDYGFFKRPTKIMIFFLYLEMLKIFFDGNDNVFEVISSLKEFRALSRVFLLKKLGRGMSFTFSNCNNSIKPSSSDISSWHLTGFCGDAFTFK